MYPFYKAIKLLGIMTAIGGINIILQATPAVSQHTSGDATHTPEDSMPQSDVKPDLGIRILTPTEFKAESFLNQGLEKIQRQDYKGAIADLPKRFKLFLIM